MAETGNTAPLPGIMPGRLPEGNAPSAGDFDPVALARQLLRATRAGTLATLDRHTGHPFASLVNVATDVDGAPLILVSRLATHTANLAADPRASVLLAAAAGKGDPLAQPRLTVLGTLAPVVPEAAERARRRFLSRHPKSRLYAGFADFSFWGMQVVSAHLNGGFARAADLAAGALLTRVDDAAGIVAAEEGALEHLNADHREALRLYAARLLGEADGAWEATGVDPDGLDLALGARTARLPFPERVVDGHALRRTLADLASRARASG